MRGVALRHGYLQAADASFIDHITLMLKDLISTNARPDGRCDEGVDARSKRKS